MAKATVVKSGVVINLELSGEEAILVYQLTQNLGGSGPIRKMNDEINGALYSSFVKSNITSEAEDFSEKLRGSVYIK